MPAYIIVMREGPLRDSAAMNEYQKRTRQMQSDIKPMPRVIYGAIEGLEGEAPEALVMLEFPSMDDARAWYNSDGYQDALPYRLQSGEYRTFLVEGL